MQQDRYPQPLFRWLLSAGIIVLAVSEDCAVFFVCLFYDVKCQWQPDNKSRPFITLSAKSCCICSKTGLVVHVESDARIYLSTSYMEDFEVHISDFFFLFQIFVILNYLCLFDWNRQLKFCIAQKVLKEVENCGSLNWFSLFFSNDKHCYFGLIVLWTFKSIKIRLKISILYSIWRWKTLKFIFPDLFL